MLDKGVTFFLGEIHYAESLQYFCEKSVIYITIHLSLNYF